MIFTISSLIVLAGCGVTGLRSPTVADSSSTPMMIRMPV